jgi:DnaJ-class molecular chaperone
VATDTSDDASAQPVPCSPCRGTGKVISNLGGTPSTIECAWCEGTGTYTPGHDAQARRRGDSPAE